jgi:hypothetical protein
MTIEIRCSAHPKYEAKTKPARRVKYRVGTKMGKKWDKKARVWYDARIQRTIYSPPCDTCMVLWELKHGGHILSEQDNTQLEMVPA